MTEIYTDFKEKGDRMPYRSKGDWKFIAVLGIAFIIGGIIAGK